MTEGQQGERSKAKGQRSSEQQGQRSKLAPSEVEGAEGQRSNEQQSPKPKPQSPKPAVQSSKPKSEILAELARSVDAMDEDAAVKAAHEALNAGIPAYEAITRGLSKGMEVVGDKYERSIYFVPEILLCADAMYAAIDVLKPHLKADARGPRTPVVIGVIQGDIHDIGKNIVKLMLDAAGFPVHDLGNDVRIDRWIARAKELKSGILAVSTLMSTTMPNMGKLIDALKKEGLRDAWRVMIGGGPVSKSFAEKIGADACGANAMEAVTIANAWEEAKK